MELDQREQAVLARMKDGDWHRPARLISAALVYQRVMICLRWLTEFALVERQPIDGGSVRPRYQYRISAAGQSYLAEAQGGERHVLK